MLNGKNILVVVPARGGSKGIHLKNLTTINGDTLVSLVGKVVRQLKFVDNTVISTDHPKIAEEGKRSGLDAPFMRPENLSGDAVSDISVLVHALGQSEKAYDKHYDLIVMLQPTSPLRTPQHVSDVINKLAFEDYDSALTVSATDSKHHPYSQLVISNDRVKRFTDAGKSVISRQELPPLYHRNGAAYALTRDCLLNHGKKIGNNATFVLIKEPMVNIDTQWDLEVARWLMDSREKIET